MDAFKGGNLPGSSNFTQLVKENTLSRLKNTNDPRAVAGAVADGTLRIALQSASKSASLCAKIASETARGIVGAFILRGYNVRLAEEGILEASRVCSLELGLDPEWTRRGALAGIAQTLGRATPADAEQQLEDAPPILPPLAEPAPAAFNLGQLTKEMAVSRLKSLGDPYADVAEIVYRTLSLSLKTCAADVPAAVRMVADVSHGAMVALQLSDLSLPKGARLIFAKVSDAAAAASMDPAPVRGGCLIGIAKMHRVLEARQLDEIRLSLEAGFLGAGKAFAEALKMNITGANSAEKGAQ